MRGDGKGEPEVHAAGVTLYRRIDKPFHFRKGDDLVKLPLDLSSCHTQDGAVQVDVLATSELRVESCSDLQQGADASVELGETGRGLGDAREDF